jgi:hypothetical protein
MCLNKIHTVPYFGVVVAPLFATGPALLGVMCRGLMKNQSSAMTSPVVDVVINSAVNSGSGNASPPRKSGKDRSN